MLIRFSRPALRLLTSSICSSRCFVRTAPLCKFSFPTLRCRCLSTTTKLHKNSLPASEKTMFITQNCVKRLKELSVKRNESVMLRVFVDPGGCSGYRYDFKLDTVIRDDDIVVENDGVAVLVDPVSWEFLEGATVDYTSEMIRSAFVVATNPNAAAKCSCGSSFDLKKQKTSA
eukprot:TRINITY_DN2236_c0_g1_i1.p1 TRINITY_DN2236_c0_g1~~TRINITY_DN2236_c0_g1_i1.p1  ORF type:complete len:173 (-),score=14.65 TRINITY_DN2236_c0_g1_i1:418-936(-)